jgi:hypothetical protein
MPLDGAGGKGARCEPVQARVRPHRVVVDPPGLDDPTRGRQAGEQMLVEAFIAHRMFYEFLKLAILHKPSGSPRLLCMLAEFDGKTCFTDARPTNDATHQDYRV